MLRNGSLTLSSPRLRARFACYRTLPAQEDCPRGTLDKAYCDRNGDLTADLPTDPKQIINPSTLIFSYTPVEDPAVYQKVWDGFIKHLEKITGKRVRVLPGAVERRAIRGDALRPPACRRRQRRRQCARGELRGLRAVHDDGGARTDSFGYEMEIIVPADSPIKTPADLKGHKIAFTDADLELRLQGAVGDSEGRLQSRGQARLRAGVLRQARQLDPWRRQQGLRGRGGGQFGAQPDARPQGVRSRPRSARSTSRRRSRPPAMATSTTSIRSWSRRSRKPSSASPGKARRWRPSSRRKSKFIPIDYKKDWAVLRKIDEATGVKYTCK